MWILWWLNRLIIVHLLTVNNLIHQTWTQSQILYKSFLNIFTSYLGNTIHNDLKFFTFSQFIENIRLVVRWFMSLYSFMLSKQDSRILFRHGLCQFVSFEWKLHSTVGKESSNRDNLNKRRASWININKSIRLLYSFEWFDGYYCYYIFLRNL